MADVEVTYENTLIKSLSATGQAVLHTAGKYCDDDITIDYTAPGGATKTLDDIVYEGLSYRDIFMTANQLAGFDFENGVPTGCTVNAGNPTVSTDDYSSASHSLKCFGTSSQQYKSVSAVGGNDWNKYSGIWYFCAMKVNCERYVTGYLGVTGWLGMNSQSAVTDGWSTIFMFPTTNTGFSYSSVFVGSYTSANLDGYIDDIVFIPMTSIFTNQPNNGDMVKWYLEYCEIRHGS